MCGIPLTIENEVIEKKLRYNHRERNHFVLYAINGVLKVKG